MPLFSKNKETAMKIEFSKMHGAGNDYVYVDCTAGELPDPGAISEYVSHRRFGIGSDGLIMICSSDKADFKMRIFNADRSEGKMCGNGIRCVAKFVYDKGLTDKTELRIDTLSGVKTVKLNIENGKAVSAKVDMGAPVFRTKEVPMICDHFVFVDQGLVLKENYNSEFPEKIVYNGTALSMGNPHFVTFVDDVDALDWGLSSSITPCSPKGSTPSSCRSSTITPSNSECGNGAAARPGLAAPGPVR